MAEERDTVARLSRLVTGCTDAVEIVNKREKGITVNFEADAPIPNDVALNFQVGR